MGTIYFDNGSTSFPKAPRLGEVMGKQIEEAAYNINRGGYEEAYELGDIVMDTREMLCEFFHGSDMANVVFTGGNTLSINMTFQGLLSSGDHVLISSMEHNAVVRPLEAMTKDGITWDAIPCNQDGELEVNLISSMIKPNTKMIFIMHASNVCGTLLPIEEVGLLCKKHNLLFGVDGAQSAGTYPIHMEEMNIDILTIPGHKCLMGPQGIGVLMLSQRTADMIKPVLHGGTGSTSDQITMPQFMPDKLEAGTMNLTGIVGLHHALSYIITEGMDSIAEKKKELTAEFLRLLTPLKKIRVVGRADTHNRCSVVSVDCLGKDNAEVAYLLEHHHGISTRCGLHCAPLAHQTLGTFPHGTIRFSLGYFNTIEEVHQVVDSLMAVL